MFHCFVFVLLQIDRSYMRLTEKENETLPFDVSILTFDNVHFL